MAPSAGEQDERAQRRVLVVAFCVVPSATGDGISVLSTIRALNRRYSIDVVSVKNESLPHIERFHRARLLRVPLGTASEAERMEAFRRAVRRQLEGESYDVVHVRGPLEGVPVCEMRELRGYKILYELATFPSTEPGVAADSARRDEMYCLSTADVVLVASEASRAHLYQRGVGERVAVIPRGVDVDLFDWDFARPSQVPLLMAIGPFPKSRDVGTMLQATSLLVRELPVRLRLVGETDPARASVLADRVRTLDLVDWVEIAPAPELEDLPAEIGLCDAGIASAAPVDRYLRAGDSVPGLLEFMACRRPVIAARIPAIRDVFAERRELIFYEPGDPESLAEAILGLLRSTTRRETLAQAGYRRVREEFPASATRRRLLSVYRTLADTSTDSIRLGISEPGTGDSASPEPVRTPTPIGVTDLDTFIVAASRPEREDFTPPRDTSPGTPLSEVAIIDSRSSDRADRELGPPGAALFGSLGRGKETDTDPELRVQKPAAPEPAVVVGPLGDAGTTRGDDGQTGEIPVDELPRETTRSVMAAAVATGASGAGSPESDFADEPTRSIPLPKAPDRPDTDSMAQARPAALASGQAEPPEPPARSTMGEDSAASGAPGPPAPSAAAAPQRASLDGDPAIAPQRASLLHPERASLAGDPGAADPAIAPLRASLAGDPAIPAMPAAERPDTRPAASTPTPATPRPGPSAPVSPVPPTPRQRERPSSPPFLPPPPSSTLLQDRRDLEADPPDLRARLPDLRATPPSAVPVAVGPAAPPEPPDLRARPPDLRAKPPESSAVPSDLRSKPLVPRPPSSPRLPAMAVKIGPPPPAPPPKKPVIPPAPPPPAPGLHDGQAAASGLRPGERSGVKPAPHPPPPVRPSSAPGARSEPSSPGFAPEATARVPSMSGTPLAATDAGASTSPAPDFLPTATGPGPRPTPPFPFFPLPPLDLGVDGPLPEEAPAADAGSPARDLTPPSAVPALAPQPPTPPSSSPSTPTLPVPIEVRQRRPSGLHAAAGAQPKPAAAPQGPVPQIATPPEPEIVTPPSLEQKNDTVPLTHEIVAPPPRPGAPSDLRRQAPGSSGVEPPDPPKRGS